MEARHCYPIVRMNLETITFRPAYKFGAEKIAEFARNLGLTHALTLQPGLMNFAGRDPERFLLPMTGKLLELYARHGRGQGRRACAKAPSKSNAPDSLLIPENFGKSRSGCPHLHGMIALREGEEPLFRGFLRDYFGVDETSGKTSPSPRDLPAVRHLFGNTEDRTPIASEPVPVDVGDAKWILRSKNCRPTFDLKPLGSIEGWCGYINKHYARHSDTPFLFTPDLLEHAPAFKQQCEQSLIRRRLH